MKPKDSVVPDLYIFFHHCSNIIIYWTLSKKQNESIFSHFFLYYICRKPKKLFRLSIVCLPLIHLLIILFLFSLPISMFHFCELVCSLLYSSMNLLALVVVKFLNMLLCFYLNSSLLYASSRIRTLNKLYKSFYRNTL